MFWELLQTFRHPKDFLGCPRLLGFCQAAALSIPSHSLIEPMRILEAGGFHNQVFLWGVGIGHMPNPQIGGPVTTI